MLAVSVELKFTTMYLEMNIQLESSLEKKLILMNKWAIYRWNVLPWS